MKWNHVHLKSVESTHGYASINGADLDDHTVITTDFQTMGHGRYDRNWISGDGDSLLLSMVLKPKIQVSGAPLLTPLLSVAASKLLKSRGVSADIRWPNDILVNNRKIAGILADASTTGSSLDYVIVSMGMNVKQSPEDLSKIGRPATSIFVETGKSMEPDDLLKSLLDGFDPLYEEFIRDGFSRIANIWQKNMDMIGDQVFTGSCRTSPVINMCKILFLKIFNG